MLGIPIDTALAWGIWVAIIYVPTLAIYRLHFSPLAGFPGPKLAALTLWYEFYYDVVLSGQYTFHITKLHCQYGPIIRINPHELHILDSSYYSTLYASNASGEKRDKWGWYTKQFGTSESMFSTTTHEQHKRRRAALNRFFSTASVRKLQPLLEERLQQLLKRVREAKASEEAIPLEYAFAAFTNDVVTQYAYGESDQRLERDDWGPEYFDAAVEAGKGGSLLKQMIWIHHFLKSLPVTLQAKINPGLELLLRLHERAERIIAGIKSSPLPEFGELAHPTLFHEILQSNLPDSDKAVSRLKDEALIVVGAGTVTTSWALALATYYLLAEPQILRKLKDELQARLPEPDTTVPLPQLEELPYLTAVIQEALRLSYGVCSRLQRISPDKSLVYTEPSGKTWVIPKGVPVGMTSVHVHHDETIFPDSHSFRPERWLDTPRLDKYLVAFSKGSRQCLGINLAYAEMYLCLSTIFRRFGSSGSEDEKGQGVRFDRDEGALELLTRGEQEVRMEADGFIPFRRSDAEGLKICVRP